MEGNTTELDFQITSDHWIVPLSGRMLCLKASYEGNQNATYVIVMELATAGLKIPRFVRRSVHSF